MGGKVVVVTGSTRGIGRGLAREFLKRGHSVAVSGRTRTAVDEAVAAIENDAVEGARAVGIPCDVASYEDVQSLWDRSIAAFGRVDIWINNAGQSNSRFTIGKLAQDEVDSIPRVNLTGTINGSRVALAGMTKQGSGALYNFEGFGSNGMRQPGMSLYGATKFGITYFNKCLERETKGGPVLVGLMSPGIVITDLSTRDKETVPLERWNFTIKIYNILADRVETVTPWLVERVLANTKHAARISWLTPGKSVWRFLKSRFSPPGDRFPELKRAA
ncbi:MAG: SDR family oxidoreductase [Alphaproteobacteria bacterium]|nr:SDR family oxidoreductase [Alphaproteobacteria bacterium]